MFISKLPVHQCSAIGHLHSQPWLCVQNVVPSIWTHTILFVNWATLFPAQHLWISNHSWNNFPFDIPMFWRVASLWWHHPSSELIQSFPIEIQPLWHLNKMLLSYFKIQQRDNAQIFPKKSLWYGEIQTTWNSEMLELCFNIIFCCLNR